MLDSGAIYNTKNKENKIPLRLTENSTIKNLLNSVDNLFKDVRAGNHKHVTELISKEKTIVVAIPYIGLLIMVTAETIIEEGTSLYYAAAIVDNENVSLLHYQLNNPNI